MYKIKRFGYCPKSGCVTYDKKSKSWRVINNKKGGFWKAHYKTKEKAEASLRAYHANKGK